MQETHKKNIKKKKQQCFRRQPKEVHGNIEIFQITSD